MRKIDILNKDYEKIGLDTIVYTNKTIDEVCYIDSDGKEYKYSDIVGGDYNNKVKNATGWSYSLVGSTDRFSINLLSVLDYIPVDVADIADVRMKINNIEFEVKSVATINVLDEYAVGTRDSDGNLYIGLPTSLGLTTSALLEAWLQSNEVEFIFLKSTFLPISEPGQSQYDTWIDIFRARYLITKETYTLREFMELNLVDNSFFQEGTDEWIFDADSIVSVSDGIVKVEFDTGATLAAQQGVPTISGHDYYLSIKNAKTDMSTEFYIYIPIQGDEYAQNYHNIFSEITNGKYNNIYRFTSTSSNYAFILGRAVYVNGTYMTVSDVVLFDMISFDENMNHEIFDYIIALYKRIKYEINTNGKTYSKTGISKNDIAYTNKSIDEIVYEGKTLRDIFEHGNEVSNPFFKDADNNELADGYTNNNCINLDVSNGVQSFENDGINTSYIGYSYNLLANINYYYAIDMKASADNSNAMNHSGSLGITDYTGNGLWQRLSTIFSHSVDFAGSFRIGFDNELSNNEWAIKNFALIVLDTMFIINPSQAQLDEWWNMYLVRKDLEKLELSYSDIFENSNEILNGDFTEEFSNWVDYRIEDSLKLYEDGYVIAPKEVEFGTQVAYIRQNQNAFIINGDTYYWALDSQSEIYETSISVHLNREFKDEDDINRNEKVYVNEKGYSSEIFTVNTNYTYYYFGFYDTGNTVMKFGRIVLINTKIFDERITKEQIDTMLATYQLIKNIIIEPEVFLITEPIGFGKRYKMLSINDQIYGHELDFEQMQFKVNFGINYNAYEGYNLTMIFLKNDEAIIEYDWGKGSRFADVRLLQAPKTEKDTLSLIISKFAWELLNPFYELLVIEDESEVITNSHSQDLKPLIEFNANQAAISIELENQDSTLVEQEIAFDFTGESFPLGVTIDCEKKTITLDDGRNGYDFLDLSKESFLSLVEGIPYKILFTGIVSGSNKVTLKQWVVD